MLQQLELDLFQSLEAAIQYPQTADMQHLCDALEGEIRDRSVQAQLEIAGESLRQISEVYAAKAELLMAGWEQQHNPQEPLVHLEEESDLFVQSQSLHLGDLFEDPEPVQYPSDRQPRATPTGTVVGLLDKAALLAELDQRLEQHPELSEAEAFDLAIGVSHDEDVSQWLGAIGAVFLGHDSLSLLELQQQLGMPLVKVWLALLLGGYAIEQRGGFYENAGIMVASLGAGAF